MYISYRGGGWEEATHSVLLMLLFAVFFIFNASFYFSMTYVHMFFSMSCYLADPLNIVDTCIMLIMFVIDILVCHGDLISAL